MLLKFQDFSSSTFSWTAAGPWRLVCGSDNAMTGRFRSSAQGAKKKTQYRTLRGWGQARKEVSNVSFILLCPWGHTPNAVVHSHPQSKQNERFKKKTKTKQHFISVLSIKCTVRDGVRMLCILREMKTRTWNEAEHYRVSGWESHSQCPWPAECAQTERISCRPSSLQSSHLARSHPAIHLHKSSARS